MTWPEYLDLLLTILAQTPHGRAAAGTLIGMILIAVVIMAATLTVADEDMRRRDVYYEDYVDDH